MANDGIESHEAPENNGVEQPAATKRPGVRRALLAGVIVAAIGGGAWLLHYETRGKYLEDTNDAYIQADAVTISPKISGYVEQVLVGDNQDVKAGQALVRIDPRDYDAQAQQYQAQIDVAKANADNVRAGIGEQEAGIAQARAQLASAEEDARYAEREAARYAPLAASGAETKTQLANLRNQAAKARAAADAQRAALLSAERRIGSLKAQIRQAEAQGEAAKAQLAAAHVNVGSTVLKASVDGRIGDRTVRAGQFVQAGTRLMSVVPLSKLYVTANFKETQIGLMRPGQPATIQVDALDGTKIRGHVESISPGTGAQFSLLPPQNATGNFTKIVQRVPVRIAIDAGPEARRVLVPGLSVIVTVDTIAAKGSQGAIAKQEEARRDGNR
ncbi:MULTISPECIES: HlyD family secretion protein [Novosphingobium]|uniref:HlyD family secretion protein n=1 Tax=Novosphingobium pentaromativorans TaxID=205844 RepID=A0A2W5NSY2_9SPHN|nr:MULTISPECIES: HlyD family secretion protein [Novosphingobium]PZQ56671.1 MAG: HlyD family secretion protein [Novosphingobium pentaromativorans]GFE74931.1 transporter [Novosphingobium sp. TCA1]